MLMRAGLVKKMTAIYNVGSYNPDSTVLRLNEMMKSIPKGKFHFRPIPSSYSIASTAAISDEAANNLIEHSLGVPAYVRHCRACFPVCRDLQVFSMPHNTNPAESKEYIRWVVNLQELVASAKWGCGLCGLMASRFFNDPGYSFIYFLGSENNPKPPFCCCAASEEVASEVLSAAERLQKFCEKHTGAQFTFIVQPTDYSIGTQGYGKIRFQVVSTTVRDSEWKSLLGFRREIVIEVYAHPGDIANKYLYYLPPNLEPGSEESFELARTWIKRCINTHPQCPKPVPTRLPTRVVESGFNISDLPKTIQDAVTVTRNLGLKYLWVDSLYILQDSEEDKLRELPRMADYYKNSSVTIAAGRSSCKDGFLQPRTVCEKHSKGKAIFASSKGDFLRGLLWSTYPTMKLLKPDKWSAPSWSWASTNNVVEYRRMPSDKAMEISKVNICRIKPKSPVAPLGEIAEAELEIQGPVLRPHKEFTVDLVRHENMIPEERDDKDWRAKIFDLESREWMPQPNSELWEPPKNHILLLLVVELTNRHGKAKTEVEGYGTISGLILAEVGEGKYERIGSFTGMLCKGNMAFQKEVETVTII
ncbi:hypothetical protein GP486_002029 [Trichoglossum hirsutum]|uniref:Heterokaryon incompatibility domain-containing protein n=1 Tax=Trichoglossum hirsutum TaxID=265104 RepID=A0A9P8RSG9_9PEZI|nr:hypothetical protein GP486_002029 [Trichoglossum hirsutum]